MKRLLPAFGRWSRKNVKILLLISIILVFLGVVGYGVAGFWKQNQIKKINSFETCSQSGFPILESYPEQCRTPDGRSFVKELADEEKEKIIPPSSCKNLCGDGVCQEVVCMAIGCPCAETKETCAQDCVEGQGNDGNGTGIANPASVYCEEHGGRVDIRSDSTGNQTGYCIFPDGSECEEWAYFRGQCLKENKN